MQVANTQSAKSGRAAGRTRQHRIPRPLSDALKYMSVAYSQTAVNDASTAVTTYTSNIPQGTTDTARIGDSLCIRAIEWCWTALPAAVNALTDQSVRFILFKDESGTGISSSAILLNDETYGTMSPTNVDYGQRMEVIEDKLKMCPVAAINATPVTCRNGAIFKGARKCKIQVDYSAASTTCIRNGLSFLWRSNNSVASGFGVTVNGYINIFYTDVDR